MTFFLFFWKGSLYLFLSDNIQSLLKGKKKKKTIKPTLRVQMDSMILPPGTPRHAQYPSFLLSIIVFFFSFLMFFEVW